MKDSCTQVVKLTKTAPYTAQRNSLSFKHFLSDLLVYNGKEQGIMS